MKTLIMAGIALAAANVVSAATAAEPVLHAQSRDAAADFLKARLSLPEIARVETASEAFLASAVIDGAEWTGHAVKVSVWAPLGPRGQPVMRRYKVLLVGADTFVLRRDVKKFKRLRAD